MQVYIEFVLIMYPQMEYNPSTILYHVDQRMKTEAKIFFTQAMKEDFCSPKWKQMDRAADYLEKARE